MPQTAYHTSRPMSLWEIRAVMRAAYGDFADLLSNQEFERRVEDSARLQRKQTSPNGGNTEATSPRYPTRQTTRI